MKRIPLFLFLILSVINCFAQTQIDPTYQIQWNLLSGSGAPSMTCTQSGNYTVYPYGAEWGQSYQDTTNNVEYKCTTSGWVKNLPITGGTLTGPLVVGTGTPSITLDGSTGNITVGSSVTDGQAYQAVTNPPVLPGVPVYAAATAALFGQYTWQGTPSVALRDQTAWGFNGIDSSAGSNYGYTNSAGPNGWSILSPTNINITHLGAGQLLTIKNYSQFGMGDFSAEYNNYLTALGVQAPSDEGVHDHAGNIAEDPVLFSGTVITPPSSGGNTIAVNSTTGPGHQGAMRLLLDLTAPIAAGNFTAYTAASGEMPEKYTVTVSSGLITSSTAWGTLASSCGQQVFPTGTFPSGSYTITLSSAAYVNGGSGIAGTGIPSGTKITALSGTTATISNLTTLAESGTPLTISTYLLGAQTVPSNCTVNVTSGTFASGSYDSFAGTWHETAQDTSVTVPSGGQQTVSLSLRQAHEANSWVMEGGISGSCIVFTANIGDNFKYPITVLGFDGTSLYTRPFAFGGQPSGMYSNSGNMSLSSGASTAFTIYPCAQVSDPQGPAQVNPPTVAGPTTAYVEPTPWAWTAGDTVEEEHDAGYRIRAFDIGITLHNPCAQKGEYNCWWEGYGVSLQGAGMVGEGFGNIYAGNGGTDRAAFYAINNNSLSSGYYTYQPAPSAMRLSGPFDEWIGSRNAPATGMFFAGCPLSTTGDNCASTTPYDLFENYGLTYNGHIKWTSSSSTYAIVIGACTYSFGPAGFVNSCAAGNNALTSYTTFLDGFGAYGNMLHDPQFQAGATYWTSYGGSTLTPNTTDYPDPWGGHTALKILTTNSTQYYQPSSSLAVGNTATSSVYACGAVGGESILFGPAQSAARSNATLPACSTGWGRFANTTTIATTPTADFFLVDYTAGQTIYLAGAQTELQAQAGPYVRAAPISGDGFVSQGNVYPAPSSILTTASALSPSTPPWLQYLSNGADGANTNASGNMSGEYYYTNFTVPYGNTVTVNYSSGLIVHATGTCTIAGTIEANGATAGAGSGYPINSSGGGGSGGGASAGTAGQPFYVALSAGTSGNGLAGAVSGGNGTNGGPAVTGYKRTFLGQGDGQDGQFAYGGGGKQGANSGGAAGNGGAPAILMCASITGTDGTHTGIIDASGGYGAPPAANSTGAGSGGGGGVVVLSSQAAVATWPSIYTAGGPGGLVTVPEAAATSGTCTSQPKATLGVTSGALSSCTVVQAGAGCGTGTNVTFNILGGGGSGGTVTPTWSGGALASCTASGGSGYTAATYTTSGTGGDGGAGWSAEFQGW
jgi:hypothetical protein